MANSYPFVDVGVTDQGLAGVYGELDAGVRSRARPYVAPPGSLEANREREGGLTGTLRPRSTADSRPRAAPASIFAWLAR